MPLISKPFVSIPIKVELAPVAPTDDWVPEIETPALEERIEQATESIYNLFDYGHVVYVAFSGGKDGSLVADLVLNAARMYSETGIRKPCVAVLHGDTKVENPEVREHARRDLQRMKDYADRHGFDIQVGIAEPSLATTWQYKILSGRGLPSFPGQSTDCSNDLKITPQNRMRRELNKGFKELGFDEPVTCLGTRYDESSRRSANMTKRGENAYKAVRNKNNELILSPICDWTTDEVFEYLGTRDGAESYSDFKDTLRLYAHAESQSCAVVAATIESGKQKKGGCGARHGCFVCQQSVDKSLENMIQFDERYEYARGLNALNKFIRNTRYDMDRRHWVGRTIKGGYVMIAPDTYHPKMVRELYRYMVQIQYDEQVRARRAGEEPKFTLLTDEMVLAIDAAWSLNGLARPFSAWVDLQDIYSGQVRYDIPETEPYPRVPMPKPKFLHVGKEWDDTAGPLSALTGMRDSYIEALTEGSPCQPKLRPIRKPPSQKRRRDAAGAGSDSTEQEHKSNHMIWDVPTALEFGVNAESLCMLEDFELGELIDQARHDHAAPLLGGITAGYKFYLRYGALDITPGQRVKHDEVLRRTAYKDRLGLTLEYDIEDLLSRSISFDELPDDAKKAWTDKSKRRPVQPEDDLAAEDLAQMDLLDRIEPPPVPRSAHAC